MQTSFEQGGENMELRSMFKNIFGSNESQKQLTRAQVLDGYSNDFIPFKGSAYDNATVRDCIDVIARHAGKLKGVHIVRKDGNIIDHPEDKLNYLLSVRPNWLMTASEFLEKVMAQYLLYNNAIIYPQRDRDGNVVALWPLHYDSIDPWEDKQGYLYFKFTFGTGQQKAVPYSDVIHIRRQFNRDELFGESLGNIMTEDLNVFSAVKAAIINAVKNGTRLRGLLHWKSVMRPEDQKSLWEEFIENFTTSDNGSGIASLDNRADFQQLTTEIETFDSSKMQFVRDNIYKHFGISEKILMGTYKEEEYQAFYESVIEPFALKLAQECTEKLFTSRQRGFGNEIMFESNRLNYMTVASKARIADIMVPAGAIKRNELRELFGYAGLPGKEGEEIVVSLNYVKTTDQSKYQVGKEGGEKDDET